MARQDRDIKYTNKEFSDFREQLINYTKNYFPDSYNDFSPTSPGMMFMEMAAYVGDILSFYQDTQLQETFLQHAKDPANLFSIAYMMGYRPKVTTVAEVDLEVSQVVSVDPITKGPNYKQALSIAANAVVVSQSQTNTSFIVQEPIDFSLTNYNNPTEVLVETISNGKPTELRLTKKVKAFSSEIRTISETFTSAEKFTTINIDDSKIVGILDIIDSEGNVWYEVPFLGQETIINPQQNTGFDKQTVNNILEVVKVPRRFTTRFNSQGQLQIQFGAGTVGGDDQTFTPNPENVGLGNGNGISTITHAYDPSNLLYTGTYGLAPTSTTLTIRYLVGGGVEANVPANTLTEFTATISAQDTLYQSTLSFNNPQPAQGGRDGDTVEELRQNALRAFNEQGRMVTLQDYNVRALSIPSKYGSVAKAYTIQDEVKNQTSSESILESNPLALSMYILAYDVNKKLVSPTNNLKQNLKKYLSEYMMLTDAINLKDAFVVNIGINYDVILRPNYNSRDVLLRCNELLVDYFDSAKWSINQPINLSNVYTLLDKVPGVQTVQNVTVDNKAGGDYSHFSYDTFGATRNNIVYPSQDIMIFEVKFPEIDIKGRTVTL